jgi:hypothetical protein
MDPWCARCFFSSGAYCWYFNANLNDSPPPGDETLTCIWKELMKTQEDENPGETPVPEVRGD